MTESTVYWKFKSERRATPHMARFFGPRITARCLKDIIVAGLHLNQKGRKDGSDCDIRLFDEDRALAPEDQVARNTRIIVSRIPKGSGTYSGLRVPVAPATVTAKEVPVAVHAAVPVAAAVQVAAPTLPIPTTRKRHLPTPACSICSDAPREAVTSTCCLSLYCNECIHQELAQSGECPVCHEALSSEDGLRANMRLRELYINV